MLCCALASLVGLVDVSQATSFEVAEGAVADVRRLPSGLVEVALEQGRKYLVERSAVITCDGSPAYFDESRKYAGGLAATLTLSRDQKAVQVAFSSAAKSGYVAPAAIPDALGEVNAARAQRGLPPYIKDEGLTQAAQQCAQLRAANFVHGHLGGPMSDFACVPPGTVCTATGAGALTPDWGWGSCCTYDRYTYAGAAMVMGADGRRYMSLFVR